MQEIGYFIYFVVIYLVLTVVFPAKLLGMPLLKKGASDSIARSLTVSHAVLISVVYVLALLHIYDQSTLVVALAALAAAYVALRRKGFLPGVEKVLVTTDRLSRGQYSFRILFKDHLQDRRKKWKKAIVGGMRSLSPGKLLCFGVFLIAFAFLLACRLTPFLGTYAYLSSDMYVHNQWINQLEAGDIFYDGVYPFGMHNMISALHLLSGLHIDRVIRYYGAVNGVMTALAAVWFLRKTCRSCAAPMIYMVLYGVTDFAGNIFSYRMSYTLPQECGMPFLLLSAVFLGQYLEERRRSDGVCFAFAFSTIISMHFFTAIFAAFLCGGVGLAYLRKIWKEKLFLPLTKLLLLILCISLVPFLAGMLEGKSWQGSMSWALNVIEESMGEDAAGEETLEAPAEEISAEAGQETSPGTPQQIFELIVELMYTFWGYVFWGGFAYTTVWLLAAEKDWRRKQLFAVWLTVLFSVLLLSWQIVGIPRLMKEERVQAFFGYLAPVMLVTPTETIAALGEKWGRRFAELAGLAAAGCCFYATYGLGDIPFQTYFYLQLSEAAEACVRISKEYEDYTWTVVSPTEELQLVYGSGYHYELWEFIAGMEEYTEDMRLEIPTENVFFILEKRPVVYNAFRAIGKVYEDAEVAAEDAYRVMTPEALGYSEDSSMKYYNIQENRRTLEAKLMLWLEEYGKLFPDQLSVYMESDDCIVYRLGQNVHALNNLAIDYGCNRVGKEE